MLSIGSNDNNVAQKCLRYAYAQIHQQLFLGYVCIICFDFSPV